jgi:hypothetical protein
MFDNLREDAASGSYYEEEAKFQPAANTKAAAIPAKPSKRILGMTGVQRFVITFMLFMAVCVIGAMALLITNKIAF